MALFERSHFAKKDDEVGIFIPDLGRALVVWVAMLDRRVTVTEAAVAFNTTFKVIQEAVEEEPWIYVSGPDDEPSKQILELDGE